MLRSINLTISRGSLLKRLKQNIPQLKCMYVISRSFADEVGNDTLDTTIREKLQSSNVSFTEGYTCFKLKKCVYCSINQNESNSNSFSYRLFINKITGNFLCHDCKSTGSWLAFSTILSNPKDSQRTNVEVENECQKYDISDEWKQILYQNDSLYEISDDDYTQIMSDFDMKCSKEIIKKLNIRINKDRNIMFFPLYCGETISGYLTMSTSGDCLTYPRVDSPGCIAYNKYTITSKVVVVVADIKNFLALSSLNLQFGIVCLPYGVKTLPQNLLPFFESYNKIVLWLGEDFGISNSSMLFAKKLMEKRCYLVRPIKNQVSVLNALESSKDIKEIIIQARPIWHEYVTTFRSLREDILAEIQNVNEITGVPWKRFPTLNKILKGHRQGELTVLSGPTGSGKTTFLGEYSLDLAVSGVNTLWGSFEIKNSRLAKTMLQQYAGFIFTKENVDLFNGWSDKFENLPIYFLNFHGQHSIKTVMNAIDHCFYAYDISHIVIDNIQFMIDVTHEDKYMSRFWVQDVIIQSFRRFATANNCHVTLVIHPRKEAESGKLSMNSIFGSAKAIQEADNVLIIQEEEQESSVIMKKYLQVCKNRYTGDLGKVPLNFNKNSMSFMEKKVNEKENKSPSMKSSTPNVQKRKFSY